mgnify:CR=1 FL=1
MYECYHILISVSSTMFGALNFVCACALRHFLSNVGTILSNVNTFFHIVSGVWLFVTLDTSSVERCFRTPGNLLYGIFGQCCLYLNTVCSMIFAVTWHLVCCLIYSFTGNFVMYDIFCQVTKCLLYDIFCHRAFCCLIFSVTRYCLLYDIFCHISHDTDQFIWVLRITSKNNK